MMGNTKINWWLAEILIEKRLLLDGSFVGVESSVLMPRVSLTCLTPSTRWDISFERARGKMHFALSAPVIRSRQELYRMEKGLNDRKWTRRSDIIGRILLTWVQEKERKAYDGSVFRERMACATAFAFDFLVHLGANSEWPTEIDGDGHDRLIISWTGDLFRTSPQKRLTTGEKRLDRKYSPTPEFKTER
ncbi:Uncharacterized protein APZ42_014327 [Daphnia magna]|uniref:Uncharacterized protein n=1 Tax=Daphnia magna TaxID=35525 RepID=A0A162Q7G9_9CRUS|nr:Uncharacterized protein APZ42_014327 [Daphnia magna]